MEKNTLCCKSSGVAHGAQDIKVELRVCEESDKNDQLVLRGKVKTE